MARICQLEASLDVVDAVTRDLTRALESGHINFLIGSGASYPAIPLAGDIEARIEQCHIADEDDTARELLYQLLASVQAPANRLATGTPNAADTDTLSRYATLLRTVQSILIGRQNVLAKQATIFTTNYDLFLDAAALQCEAAALANGFERTFSLDGAAEFSSRRFFRTTYDTGHVYEYRVEVPAINLVKLHGCVSWQRDGDRIVRRNVQCAVPPADAGAAALKAFIDGYALVLPHGSKFNTTVLDRTYYELLRLYANTLDKENALLITFGFSFRDEHVLHITKRALKNPTLRVLIIAHDNASRDAQAAIFAAYNNAIIVSSDAGIAFDQFNELLMKSAPTSGGI